MKLCVGSAPTGSRPLALATLFSQLLPGTCIDNTFKFSVATHTYETVLIFRASELFLIFYLHVEMSRFSFYASVYFKGFFKLTSTSDGDMFT